MARRGHGVDDQLVTFGSDEHDDLVQRRQPFADAPSPTPLRASGSPTHRLAAHGPEVSADESGPAPVVALGRRFPLMDPGRLHRKGPTNSMWQPPALV